MKRIFASIIAGFISFTLALTPAFADMNKPVVTEKVPTQTVVPEYTPKDNSDDEVIFNVDGKMVGDKLVFDIKTQGAGSILLNTSSVCSFVESVKIKTNRGIETKVGFAKLDKNPSETKLDKNIGFCNIDAEKMDAEAIEVVEWNLRVNRKELNDQNLKNELMSLVKLENNKWNQIKTKKTDGNTESYQYLASSDELESGDYSFAEVKSGLFTLTNVLICLGSLFGLIILGLIVAYAMQGKDKNTAKKKQ
jgi:PGF-pre-PGF domain-containing protein